MSKEEKTEKKFERLVAEIGYKDLAKFVKRVDWDSDTFALRCPPGRRWDPISKSCIVDPLE